MAGETSKVVGAQIRAARGLLNLSAQELADLAKLSRGTIQRAELETAPVTTANGERIVETLERQGIIFLPSNGEGPGVRLRKRKR
jgi:transcriptional regulator with XRE-family HTH domain